MCALPERGVIGIHNRSHYEEVLVVRVHPEYLMGQKIPGIESVKDVDAAFWKRRFESIRNFEEMCIRDRDQVLLNKVPPVARIGAERGGHVIHRGVGKERGTDKLDLIEIALPSSRTSLRV